MVKTPPVVGLTPPEVARRWNTTTPYVYKLLKQRRLTSVRDEQGHHHVPLASIEHYETSGRVRRRTQPTPPPLPTMHEEASSKPPNGEHHVTPRRRAADVFPEFRLVLGDPGTFLRRLDDLYAELRAIRHRLDEMNQVQVRS